MLNLTILMVLTSHNQLGDTGLETGFWVEEGGRLITGQNPASSTSTAQALLRFMAAEKAA